MGDRPTYQEIVVGSDGSPTAERAVQRAAAVAGRLGIPLTVATAWYRDMPDQPVPSELAEWPGGSAGAMESAWASQTVSEAAAVGRSEGAPDVRTATPQGGPADGLLGLVEDRPESLLVVGTVGLGSRAQRLLGNVPHQVTHHSPVDVLLVRTADGSAHGGYRRIGLATDGSDTAARAVARGLGLARGLGATPVLLTVAPSEDDGAATLARARRAAPETDGLETEVVVGSRVGAALVDTAADLDLLVVGNKGMSGPSRLLGSVANEITHRVPTDLLLVNTTRT